MKKIVISYKDFLNNINTLILENNNESPIPSFIERLIKDKIINEEPKDIEGLFMVLYNLKKEFGYDIYKNIGGKKRNILIKNNEIAPFDINSEREIIKKNTSGNNKNAIIYYKQSETTKKFEDILNVEIVEKMREIKTDKNVSFDIKNYSNNSFLFSEEDMEEYRKKILPEIKNIIKNDKVNKIKIKITSSATKKGTSFKLPEGFQITPENVDDDDTINDPKVFNLNNDRSSIKEEISGENNKYLARARAMYAASRIKKDLNDSEENIYKNIPIDWEEETITDAEDKKTNISISFVKSEQQFFSEIKKYFSIQKKESFVSFHSFMFPIFKDLIPDNIKSVGTQRFILKKELSKEFNNGIMKIIQNQQGGTITTLSDNSYKIIFEIKGDADINNYLKLKNDIHSFIINFIKEKDLSILCETENNVIKGEIGYGLILVNSNFKLE